MKAKPTAIPKVKLQQKKLLRNHKSNIQPNPTHKPHKVDAQPAFLPLFMLWGLFSGRKKNPSWPDRTGAIDNNPSEQGWPNMGQWPANPSWSPGAGQGPYSDPRFAHPGVQGPWGGGPGFSGPSDALRSPESLGPPWGAPSESQRPRFPMWF